MKEMSQADELAILREVVMTQAGCYAGKGIILKDLNVSYSHPTFYARKRHDNDCLLAEANEGSCWPTAMAACIFLARQKLAAEREAAMSPRERRLTDFAHTVVLSTRHRMDNGLSPSELQCLISNAHAALKEEA